MATIRKSVTTQLTAALKLEFENAIKDEYNGASDFFRRLINAKCDVPKTYAVTLTQKQAKKGTIPLSVSVTPEQRAALLTQCEKEGVTMGTWMRNQIKEYLSRKEENK